MREGGSKIGELRGSPNLAKLQQSPPPPKWRVKDPAKVEGEARTRGHNPRSDPSKPPHKQPKDYSSYR